MAYFALFYEGIDDFCGAALADPRDSAMIVLRCDEKSAATDLHQVLPRRP
jgi:hypothetical protein